jgi:hypothetical protein
MMSYLGYAENPVQGWEYNNRYCNVPWFTIKTAGGKKSSKTKTKTTVEGTRTHVEKRESGPVIVLLVSTYWYSRTHSSSSSTLVGLFLAAIKY